MFFQALVFITIGAMCVQALWRCVRILFGPLFRSADRDDRCPQCPAGWS